MSCISTIVGCVLIQVIAKNSPVGDPITKDVDPQYQDCFPKTSSQGAFTNKDIELNDIASGKPFISFLVLFSAF
jgi:hypothetical protein